MLSGYHQDSLTRWTVPMYLCMDNYFRISKTLTIWQSFMDSFNDEMYLIRHGLASKACGEVWLCSSFQSQPQVSISGLSIKPKSLASFFCCHHCTAPWPTPSKYYFLKAGLTKPAHAKKTQTFCCSFQNFLLQICIYFHHSFCWYPKRIQFRCKTLLGTTNNSLVKIVEFRSVRFNYYSS